MTITIHEDVLDRLGKEGWELVAIRPRYFLFLVIGQDFILKRPIGDDVDDNIKTLIQQIKSSTWEIKDYQFDRLDKRLDKISDALLAAAKALDAYPDADLSLLRVPLRAASNEIKR